MPAAYVFCRHKKKKTIKRALCDFRHCSASELCLSFIHVNVLPFNLHFHFTFVIYAKNAVYAANL